MRGLRVYLLVGLPVMVMAMPAYATITITDLLYNSHHPQLLVQAAELPALAAKLSDGGIDDATYVEVRHVVQDIYPTLSYSNILGPWYGDEAIPCIGLVGLLEGDAKALALGKALTTYIADTYNPDFDEANSGMRLRALVLGYDFFFKNATPAERGHIRDEIVLYMQKMEWNTAYQVFMQPPYLGNHSAMFGAALGMASIVLRGETDSYLVTGGFAMADGIVNNLLRYQFDPNGAYNEGVFYAAWALRQLVYYFDARHRFDGHSYTDNPQFRAIEQWFAYELSPEGSGRTFNLNDSPLYTTPLAEHPTFFNWAMSAWNSGLSSWLWQHTAGGLGAGVGTDTDWTATILWNKPVAMTEPGSILPQSRIWAQRGLYYFRSGWPTGASSNDVVFSFYCGKFAGGHAQEDQGQFALTAYGAGFAIDHGAGNTAKESEAHNLVFIDGQGQYNAGSSIGTDGAITDYLLGNFADVVFGDATAAYTTHSDYNNPNVPVPGTDWSWGYSGANPVRYARRTVVCVHGGASQLPYAMLMDDIDKDGGTHSYEWRLHTASTNSVTTGANPIAIGSATATMNLHLVDPDFSAVTVAYGPFNAGNTDPASTLIRITRSTVNPKFTFLMIPRANTSPAPAVTRQSLAWGCGATVDWGGGKTDVLIRNDSGASVSFGGVTTDAAVAAVRQNGTVVQSYLMGRGRSLTVSGMSYAALNNGPASCQFSGDTVDLNRDDADFRILDTGVNHVRCRTENVAFTVSNGYVVPEHVTAAGRAPAPALSLHAQPNPFHPSTIIIIDAARRERAQVTIYDVVGRRVRALWEGAVDASRALAWDGRDDRGDAVPSGTYFVRVVMPSATRTLKLTMVK